MHPGQGNLRCNHAPARIDFLGAPPQPRVPEGDKKSRGVRLAPSGLLRHAVDKEPDAVGQTVKVRAA